MNQALVRSIFRRPPFTLRAQALRPPRSLRVVGFLIITMAMVASTVGAIGTPAASATTMTAALSGQITDAAGAPVVGATVEVTAFGESTPTATTATDTSGLYAITFDYSACSTGTLVNEFLCITDVGAPVSQPPTCPVGGDVSDDPTLGCIREIAPFTFSSCESPYSSSGFGECTFAAALFATTVLSSADCPLAFGATPIADGVTVRVDGTTEFARCTYPEPPPNADCPAGTTAVGARCIVPVPTIAGPQICTVPDSVAIDGRCIIDTLPNSGRYRLVVSPPAGSGLVPASAVIDVATMASNSFALLGTATAAPGATTPPDPGTFTSAPGTSSGSPSAADNDVAAALINAGASTNETPLSTPDTVGTVTNGALQCSAVGFTSGATALATIVVPAATSVFADHNAAMSVRVTGPSGTSLYSVSSGNPITTIISAAAGTDVQMSLLFTTIFGSVMETPCSGPVTID